MNRKIFFLIFLGFFFHDHAFGMKPKVEKGAFGELDHTVVSDNILAFLPFNEVFFVYVAGLHKGVPKRIIGIPVPSFLLKHKKSSLATLLARSCRIRPMIFEVYAKKEESEKKNSCCVKRSTEWFWKNFEKIHKLLNGTLCETVLVFRGKHLLFLRDFEKISSIKNLRGLDLNESLFGDHRFTVVEASPFERLNEFKNLRMLGLSFLSYGVEFQKLYKTVEKLNLVNCEGGSELNFASKFQNLKSLAISKISDFMNFSQFKKLRELTIMFKNMAKEDYDNVLLIITFLPKLKRLNINFNGADKKTYEYKLFLDLVKKFKNLISLTDA